MPFTLSHAVVAPLAPRIGLPASAVAAGAMAPDLPLFVRPLDYGLTHGPVSAVWTSLPIALVLLAVWVVVVRPVLCDLLPRPVSARVHQPGCPDAASQLVWRRRAVGVVLAVIGCALGIATHLVWDSFTHASGAAVAVIPALRADWAILPGYKWIQYCSSVGGLGLLGFLAARHLRAAEQPTLDGRGSAWWPWLVGSVAIVVVFVAVLGLGLFLAVGFQPAVVGGVTASTSAAAVLLLGASLRLRFRRRSGGAPTPAQ